MRQMDSRYRFWGCGTGDGKAGVPDLHRTMYTFIVSEIEWQAAREQVANGPGNSTGSGMSSVFPLAQQQDARLLLGNLCDVAAVM